MYFIFYATVWKTHFCSTLTIIYKIRFSVYVIDEDDLTIFRNFPISLGCITLKNTVNVKYLVTFTEAMFIV